MKKYTSSFLAGLLILSVLLTSCRTDNSSVPLSGTQASDTEIADTVKNLRNSGISYPLEADGCHNQIHSAQNHKARQE